MKKSIMFLTAVLVLFATANITLADISTQNKNSDNEQVGVFTLTPHEEPLYKEPLLKLGYEGLETDHFQKFGDIGQYATPALSWGYVNSLEKLGDKNAFKEWRNYMITHHLIVNGLKIGIDRERPNGGHHSFPSGHTASSFSGTAYIHRKFGWKAAKIPFLVSALTGISRLADDTGINEKKGDPEREDFEDLYYCRPPAHHWEDVLAGAIIPYVLAWTMVEPASAKPSSIDLSGDYKGFYLIPSFSDGNLGLSFIPKNNPRSNFTIYGNSDIFGINYSLAF